MDSYALCYVLQKDGEAKEEARKIQTYQDYQGDIRH